VLVVGKGGIGGLETGAPGSSRGVFGFPESLELPGRAVDVIDKLSSPDPRGSRVALEVSGTSGISAISILGVLKVSSRYV
jgi:hypothetical protein